MPFISDLYTTDLILNEFTDTKFEKSFKTLIKPTD